MTPKTPPPPLVPSASDVPTREAVEAAPQRALTQGQQLLVYTPDGPFGGTFTCTVCGAQAWQPDLLGHLAGCPHRIESPARR